MIPSRHHSRSLSPLTLRGSGDSFCFPMKVPPTITALVRSTDSFSLISRRDPPRPWMFAPPVLTSNDGYSAVVGVSHGTKQESQNQEDGGNGSAMQVDGMGEPSSQSGLGQGDGQGGGDGMAAAAASAASVHAHPHAMTYTGPVLLSRAPDTLSYIHTCTGYLDVALDDLFASSGTVDWLLPIKTFPSTYPILVIIMLITHQPLFLYLQNLGCCRQ